MQKSWAKLVQSDLLSRSVLTPFLVSISFKAPFLIALVVDVIGIMAAALLVVPPIPPQEIEEIKLTNFKQVILEGHRLHFFVFALFSGIISGALYVVGGFRAPYQLFLEVPVIWFGVLLGIGRLLASLMLFYSGNIREKVSLFSLYRWQIILYTVLILALGLIPAWQLVVIVFIVINAFQWGLSNVNESYLLDIIKTSKFKATLLSTHSQINEIIAAIAGFGVGFAIEHFSYQSGFLYFGLILAALLIPLYLYITKKHMAVNNPVNAST